MTVHILGANGMVGHVVSRHLSDIGLEVKEYIRRNFSPHVPYFLMDKGDWVINCIGVTRHRLDEVARSEHSYTEASRFEQDAIYINGILPRKLAVSCVQHGAYLIHISTDCVFSGELDYNLESNRFRNGYREDDRPDAKDLYGVTKSIGDCFSPNAVTLRCSMVGPEIENKRYLWEWVKKHDDREIDGYVHHRWNGVTTLALARIIRGVIAAGYRYMGLTVQHVMPADWVSKYDLMKLIASAEDIHFYNLRWAQTNHKDMRLDTRYPEVNKHLWEGAGYTAIPSIADLVSEMAQWHKERF